jgi:hypothetical protein
MTTRLQKVNVVSWIGVQILLEGMGKNSGVEYMVSQFIHWNIIIIIMNVIQA